MPRYSSSSLEDILPKYTIRYSRRSQREHKQNLEEEQNMQGLTRYTKGEVFQMSEIPVQLGKVELPGDQWNKIAVMLEERDRFLKSKAILVETRYRSEGASTYQCLSEDEVNKQLAEVLQKIEKMEEKHPRDIEEAQEKAQRYYENKYSSQIETYKTKIAELKLDIEKEKTFSDKLLQRGLWRRIFNKGPKPSKGR